MKIASKQDFQELSERGVLGNRLQVFWSCRDALKSGVKYFTLRGTRPQWHGFYAIAARRDLSAIQHRMRKDGHLPKRDYYFQEIPDPSRPRTNIEAMQDETSLNLYIEPNTLYPVRGIRQRCKPLSGATARLAMGYIMEPYRSDIDAIWERFPSAIIEASLFPRPCGTLHQHLVIWEVRDF